MQLSRRPLNCLKMFAIALAVAAVPLGEQVALGQATATAAGVAVAPAAQPQTDVPVKLVMLYSSGVGYFEHHGSVDGNSSTEIRFKTDQINDILKSLVLQDLDKGQVTAITYPSLDPLDKLLKSFQVDVSKNLSRAALLQQLRGAKVTCELMDNTKITGTIVGVEIEKVPTGEKGDLQEIPVLNLLNENGIMTVRLPTVRFVSFDDKRLQEELNKALGALAQARDQDKKSITIQFVGDGKRRVKLGYVIEAPVWKTSYRLLLNDGAKTKPFIQGWAIVENQTDTDWNGVQLSLVSGRPISFIQDLYRPLYIPRPVVQPERYASLKPREYDEGMMKEADGGAMAKDAMNAPADAMAAPSAQKQLRARQNRSESMAFTGAMVQDEKLAVLDAVGVASAASAANLGELFQYTVAVPVNLSRQKSAMLPIIADEIDARRVSIYNAQTLLKHPLNGAMLTNSTGKHLLNGPITVIENGAYGGDARISDLPPGQQRLISYGIDLKVLMDSTSSKQDETIQTAKIVKGVLNVARKYVFTQEYKAENKSDAEKTLVIEHPLRPNWKLVTPEKAMEKTDTLYRFELPAPASKAVSLKVQEENTAWEAMTILPFDLGQLTWYSRNGQIPQNVRDALAKAVQLKQSMVDSHRQLEQTRTRLNETAQAQQQTRENMKAVGQQAQNSTYYQNQLKRMADQDAQMDTLRQQIDTLQEQLNARQKELEDYLNNLTVG